MIGAGPARAAVAVGDVFPSLAVPGMAILGGGGDLPALAGNVVLVDFWASWCPPCKASFPAMAKLHQDFARRGFVVVAVSVDEKLADAMRFVQGMRPPFLTVHDREQNLVQQVAPPAMPTSYLIGRDGKVRFIHQGYHGGTSERELRAGIESLLAEEK